MAPDQRPVELILARGLMSNLTTPAFLVDVAGTVVFFNEAAGELLGLAYETAGPMDLREFAMRFTPRTQDGRPLEIDELPLAVALREGRPVHLQFRVRSANGDERQIEDSAFPIVGNDGLRGAMCIFWDVEAGQ
jgi:PAS domain S-box-containing protein